MKMNWNKDRRKAGDEPVEFIWAPVPGAEPQSAAEASAQPDQPSAAPKPATKPRPESASPRSEQSALRPSRGVLQVSLTVLAVCVCATAVYEFGFAGSGTAKPARAVVLPAASVGGIPSSSAPSPSASASLSPAPSPGATIPLPVVASPSHAAVAVQTSTTHAAPVLQPTPSVVPTSPASTAPVTITTPSPEVTSTAATGVSGSIQCQSTSVEGVWVQSANGGSGWAPWVSSAANPDHATYSYTLPHGGEYSLHVGCGGTTSSWKVAEYSNFYGGTVNDFYCYDESSSSLYTYCAKTSS
jgi:hypothetical protein